MGNLQSGPLGPVEGVIHERLALIVTEHGQVVHVMGNGVSFEGQPAMGPGMHPAAVVRFHLQRVDEGLDSAGGLQSFDEPIAIHGSSQSDDIVRIAKPRRALQISNQLRFEGLIRNPADLGPLHRIPETDAGFVVAPGRRVVGQALGEGPTPHLLQRDGCQPEKTTQVVVGHKGFGGDRCPATHQLFVGGVLAATESPERGDR